MINVNIILSMGNICTRDIVANVLRFFFLERLEANHPKVHIGGSIGMVKWVWKRGLCHGESGAIELSCFWIRVLVFDVLFYTKRKSFLDCRKLRE